MCTAVLERELGVEPHPIWAEHARAYYHTVYASSIEDAGLPAGRYPVVVCADVLEHTVDPVGCSTSCARRRPKMRRSSSRYVGARRRTLDVLAQVREVRVNAPAVFRPLSAKQQLPAQLQLGER